MAVYQKYGVSPTGSCSTLLIQMPILLALYQVIYHIPGYIGSVRNVFQGLTTQMMGVSGYSDILTQFITDNRVTMYSKVSETLTENNLLDMFYVLKPSQWTKLADISEFSGIADTITKTAAESKHINMFLGFNITQSPMDVIREGMANGSALLIAGAILVPVLAWFTQWLNYKLMPQAPSSNNGNKTANSMENSMKTMNTVMPVFSAFMCLSFSIGIGIYWIAGALVRSVQQVVINRHMSSIDMDEVIRKNQEKAAKKREKAGLPPQKITQAATQSVRNIQVQENEEPSAEEKEAARKASTEYYNSNQEYRAGSIAAKANMVKQFDEKNSKKEKIGGKSLWSLSKYPQKPWTTPLQKPASSFRLPAINWRSRSSAKAVPDSFGIGSKPAVIRAAVKAASEKEPEAPQKPEKKEAAPAPVKEAPKKKL